MLYLSYSSVMDQSMRKFRRASHALSYLSMKTTVPHKRISRLNARRTVKLAKQLGWDPAINWRDYPCKWHLRPAHRQTTCNCELPCVPASVQVYASLPVDPNQPLPPVVNPDNLIWTADRDPVQPMHPPIHPKDIVFMRVSETK